MVICVCQNVTERDIARAVAGGCRSFDALREKLEVSTCCGTCECMARETFEQHEAALARTAVAAA
ncbi:MAG: (2Fe-2S)-binding protein [Pseudomonadota bacterium]|jgi:bacterioferritin-associated ferredoxin|nr:MAG: (2Fe-2S)-binding protein [Pseudomonadota bacterium]